MPKKKTLRELKQITSSDVLTAIQRWKNKDNIDPSRYDSRKESKVYPLLYDGNLYPSKPIFTIAYSIHYHTKIDVSELTGGISPNGVATHLKNLGFNIATKIDSQIIEDEKEEPLESIISQKEGKGKEYYVTKYERNPINRKNAIKIHGTKCMICSFDFEQFYGEAGRNFIEVHHIKPAVSYFWSIHNDIPLFYEYLRS